MNFQMTTADMYYLELDLKFDLQLYFIDPEDEIFIPMFVWPTRPVLTTLRKGDSMIEIRANKKQFILNRNYCNNQRSGMLDFIVKTICELNY